ncbi:HIT family protein [Halococcus hamelinensis]|uniref:Histidine triad (HIT) protein n=1 Tax=Halococcus hamelinensis 100A6 TaxID=1132509 RepID=M0M7N1_9EURY|nr:HIT domain-containing protein [Halococcus hamelinensis]EMA40609.1 histidine triad (HIT) protein [Halococcus hamelinensis 100A6]
MDQVFAPWRIEWVERDEESEGCAFCELPERDADREARVVARSEHAFCLLNNAPYNPGHAMVIPYRHTGDYAALDEAELHDHSRLVQRTIRAVEAGLDPDGLNTGMNLGDAAGGSIGDHCHTHVVPRWAGDTNFMPVVSDTKVIVEAIDDTYDHLRTAFADQDGTTGRGTDEAVVVDTDAP